jgi:DNA-binding transcriptional LysR family regulator
MPRNLDITALRSFVAVADAGGVTRAAGFLNLTQSAVSMQLKRLEELLGLPLFDRSGRTIALTTTGEHLLRDARRILALNDEIWNRMTDPVHEGEIRLGVPHDIVYPAIPQILQKFHAEFPRVRVNLVSSFTANLLQMHERGECEIVLTTEQDLRPGGETLLSLPLVWIGAPGGAAWRSRPLRLGFEQRCGFRPGVLAALDRAGIEWEMAVDSDSSRSVEAIVSADIAVHAVLKGTESPQVEVIRHGGALPDLQIWRINCYASGTVRTAPLDRLLEIVRDGFVAALGRDHHLASRTSAA